MTDITLPTRPKWVAEFDHLFVRRGERGFQYELINPDDCKDFIRRTIAEVIGEVPDERLRNELAVMFL